jgi:hypothetical protein
MMTIHPTGGIERGFLSFTTEKTKALGFSEADEGKPSQASMLFEVGLQEQGSELALSFPYLILPLLTLQAQMGMVDRGADLSWLSQYPGEKVRCRPRSFVVSLTL